MAQHERGERRPRLRRRAQGELEAQVLAALHSAQGPVSAAWVQERIGGDLAYTTVMTILTRLLAKNAVTRERAGRHFAWTSAADEAGLAALRMRKVLDGEPDREAVLASFVTTLSADDEQVLRGLLGAAGVVGVAGVDVARAAGADGARVAGAGDGAGPGAVRAAGADAARAEGSGAAHGAGAAADLVAGADVADGAGPDAAHAAESDAARAARPGGADAAGAGSGRVEG